RCQSGEIRTPNCHARGLLRGRHLRNTALGYGASRTLIWFGQVPGPAPHPRRTIFKPPTHDLQLLRIAVVAVIAQHPPGHESVARPRSAAPNRSRWDDRADGGGLVRRMTLPQCIM